MLEHGSGAAYRRWNRDGGARYSPDPHEMMDAAWECKHGRLPHDAAKDPACRCWTGSTKAAVPRPALVAVQARYCGCGCGERLDDRSPLARYVNKSHANRAGRRRRARLAARAREAT